MKPSKPLMVILAVVLLLVLSGCTSSPTEKDIVGKWQNTKWDGQSGHTEG